jgi:hypothetical protein
MKTFYFLFFFAGLLTMLKAQSSPTFDKCDNDTSFFRIVGSRPMPQIQCDTVYLITKSNRQRLTVEQHRYTDINNSLKRELELYKQQSGNYQELVNRHKQHVDSLNTFLLEKDTQLAEMKSLADRATQNTDKALKVAKRNRLLAIGGGVLSAILLILLAVK